MRWGLHASFQGAKGVAQPNPTYWPSRVGQERRWARAEPPRLGVEQDKVEAGYLTGQTGVWGGVGQREGTSQRIELRRLLEGRAL